MSEYDLSAWPLFRSVIDEPQADAAKPRTCLVVSPTDDPDSEVRKHAETVWKYIVRPALLDTDLSARRFEAAETGGQVCQSMIDAILDDDLVIAVLSHRNPNVYYAVALAQAAGRPLVLMIEDGQVPTFAVHGAKVISYSLDTDSVFSAVNVRRLQTAIIELYDASPAGQPFRRGASALNGGGNGGATVYERSRQFTYDRRIEMVREAKLRVDLMGVANMAVALHPDAIDAIRAHAGTGMEIRVLQCSPTNPNLASLIRDREGQAINVVRTEIEAAADAWKRICDTPDIEVSITMRRSQSALPLASAMITDREVIATPYLSSRVTSESPTLHAYAGSPYHRMIQQEFDQVWSEASTLFRVEPRRTPRTLMPSHGNHFAGAEPQHPADNESDAPAAKPQPGLLRGLSSIRRGNNA